MGFSIQGLLGVLPRSWRTAVASAPAVPAISRAEAQAFWSSRPQLSRDQEKTADDVINRLQPKTVRCLVCSCRGIFAA